MNGTLPHAQHPTRVRFVVLAVLCSLAFLTYLDRFNITQVQDDVARDLRFGELSAADEAAVSGSPEERQKRVRAQTLRYQGWMFSAFLLGYLLLEVPGGWLGDRLGARAVLAGIVVFWSAFTLLTGYSDVVIGWFVENPAPVVLVAGVVLMRLFVGAGRGGHSPPVRVRCAARSRSPFAPAPPARSGCAAGSAGRSPSPSPPGWSAPPTGCSAAKAAGGWPSPSTGWPASSGRSCSPSG